MDDVGAQLGAEQADDPTWIGAWIHFERKRPQGLPWLHDHHLGRQARPAPPVDRFGGDHADAHRACAENQHRSQSARHALSQGPRPSRRATLIWLRPVLHSLEPSRPPLNRTPPERLDRIWLGECEHMFDFISIDRDCQGFLEQAFAKSGGAG